MLFRNSMECILETENLCEVGKGFVISDLPPGKVCESCKSTFCISCEANNASRCTKCATGFKLHVPDYTCVINCPLGTTPVTENSTDKCIFDCSPSVPNCKQEDNFKDLTLRRRVCYSYFMQQVQ